LSCAAEIPIAFSAWAALLWGSRASIAALLRRKHRRRYGVEPEARRAGGRLEARQAFGRRASFDREILHLAHRVAGTLDESGEAGDRDARDRGRDHSLSPSKPAVAEVTWLFSLSNAPEN
jgi:hypothetical protein